MKPQGRARPPIRRLAWPSRGAEFPSREGQSESRGCFLASFTAWALIHKKINLRPEFIQKELRGKEGRRGLDGFSEGLGGGLGSEAQRAPPAGACTRLCASACTWECEHVCVCALGGGERTCVLRGAIITSVYETLLFHVLISFPYAGEVALLSPFYRD